MSPTLVNVTRASVEDWNIRWNGSKNSTYYQSYEWSLLWSKYSSFHFQPYALFFRFSDGLELIIPFSRQRFLGGVVCRYIASIPRVTIGGWISAKEPTPQHINIIYTYFLQNNLSISWRLNPFISTTHKCNIPVKRSNEIHAVELCGDFESIYKRFSKGYRHAINKAIREGIQIEAARNIGEWKEFYIIYCESVERWGKRARMVQPWRLLEGMYRSQSKNIKLWLVYRGEKIIAGSVCLYGQNHVAPWLGVFKKDYVSYKPMSFLYYQLIKRSHESGKAWFDLGISRTEGVRFFKESFGARPYRSPVIESESYIERIFRKLKGR